MSNQLKLLIAHFDYITVAVVAVVCLRLYQEQYNFYFEIYY